MCSANVLSHVLFDASLTSFDFILQVLTSSACLLPYISSYSSPYFSPSLLLLTILLSILLLILPHASACFAMLRPATPGSPHRRPKRHSSATTAWAAGPRRHPGGTQEAPWRHSGLCDMLRLRIDSDAESPPDLIAQKLSLCKLWQKSQHHAMGKASHSKSQLGESHHNEFCGMWGMENDNGERLCAIIMLHVIQSQSASFGSLGSLEFL